MQPPPALGDLAHRYGKLWGIAQGADSIGSSLPFVLLQTSHTQAKVSLSRHLLSKVKCFFLN